MSENNQLDNMTKIFKKALDILFLRYPIKTSLGFITGISISVLLELFSPALNEITWIKPQNIPLWGYIILGIFFLHLRTIVSYILARDKYDENIEVALNIIEEIEKRGISKWQTRELYIGVCEKVLQNIKLKQPIKNEIQQLEEGLEKPNERS